MTNIYYLGPKNSFSFLLSKNVFPTSSYSLVPKKTFEEIVANVQENGIGIFPIENSITSDVHANIDILFEHNFLMVGEGYLKIILYLLGNSHASLNDITDVYSHPKALQQCSTYTKEHNLHIHEIESTASGKSFVEGDIHNALIGSRELCDDKVLKILASNIGNVSENVTRFVFVTNDKNIFPVEKPNKASIIFTIPHLPGALARTLTHIAKEHVNVTKIQSRPIPGTEWEYSFWIDIEKESLSINEINNLFKPVTTEYTIRGIYEKGSVYES